MKTPIVGGGATGLSGRRTDLGGWQVVVWLYCAQHAISRHTGSSWLDRLANPVLRQVRGGLVTKRDGILDGLEFSAWRTPGRHAAPDVGRFQALCQIIGRGEYAVEYWSLVAVNNV